MDKMPCHITDENCNDPADVPDAIDKAYEIVIPITSDLVIRLWAENEDDAISKAKKYHKTGFLYNTEWKDDEIEVEEL